MNRMKHVNLKSLSCVAFVCCATFLFCFSAQASGQDDGTSLMLEITPPKGGSLNIVSGVHSYDRFAVVTLVATPKPGYQFVCWLGNVTNAATGTTMVFLDSPKMVIAVFARNKFATFGLGGPERSDGLYGMIGGESGGGGGSGESGGSDGSDSRLLRSSGESDASLEQAEGGPKRQSNPHLPGHNDDIPVPVPEPATITLLFTGLLMLANRRNKGVNLMDKM